MDIIVDMYGTGKFDIAIPYHNGVWQNTLDLVCKTEDCHNCIYEIWGENYGITECYYSNIDERCITEYLVEKHPKKVLNTVRHMLPNEKIKYWESKIQEKYSIEEYPELWI